jgi:hypothetical protein
MKRRNVLGLMAAAVATKIAAAGPSASARPIQLNCDLAVNPSKEADFVKYFEDVFRPVAKKHEGYVDLKLLKLYSAVRGATPPDCKFRFSLTYKTEPLRLKWVDSPEHAKAWPPMEAMLTDANFNILVYDVY